jgi:hypothetical protein
MKVVYIVLYGSFSAYPIIFSAHGLSTSTIGLCFLPVLVGFLLLVVLATLHYARYQRLALDAAKGIERRGTRNGKVEPEERLVPREYCFPTWFDDVGPSDTSIPPVMVRNTADTSHVVLCSLPRRPILAGMDFYTQLSCVDTDHERPTIRYRTTGDLPRKYAVHD